MSKFPHPIKFDPSHHLRSRKKKKKKDGTKLAAFLKWLHQFARVMHGCKELQSICFCKRAEM